MEVNFKNLVKAFNDIGVEIDQQADYLTSLDQEIGDGDHGFNINRGFKEVLSIDLSKLPSLNTIFNTVGRGLLSKVGGASGPLYGMAFINCANSLKDANSFGFNEFKILVSCFASSIQMLGKSDVNEKTMLDVWKPLELYLKDKESIDVQQTISFVLDLTNKTKDMKATKGRASYLNERSIGTIDPGSFSSYIIIKNLLLAL